MPASPIAFPALDNGMLAQLPASLTIEKLIRGTRFADGSILSAAFQARLRYSWVLRYENLSTAEWQRFMDFIAASGRGLESFVFPDPLGNLLARSGNLESSVWLSPPGLTVDPIEDAAQPKSFILTNPTTEPLTLSQTVEITGGFRTCFSVAAKWDGAASFSLSLSDGVDTATSEATAHGWVRHSISLSSGSAAATRTVGITVPPTTQIVLSSPQLEIAAAPGAYLETGAVGASFPSAWLAQRSFDSRSNAPGAHSITLRIESLRAI